MSTNRTITFTLNDAPVATTVGTHQTLLEALQAQGLTGARESCAQGLCGCADADVIRCHGDQNFYPSALSSMVG